MKLRRWTAALMGAFVLGVGTVGCRNTPPDEATTPSVVSAEAPKVEATPLATPTPVAAASPVPEAAPAKDGDQGVTEKIKDGADTIGVGATKREKREGKAVRSTPATDKGAGDVKSGPEAAGSTIKGAGDATKGFLGGK